MRRPRFSPFARTFIFAAAAVGLLFGAASCHGRSSDTISLTGAGATFPYPLYSKWISEYRKVQPTVRINYQSIGSGGGIRQITAHTVDFGASDAPMTDAELAKAPAKLLHIPTTLGAVVVVANLPGVSNELKLDGKTLAQIFLGDVAKWSAPEIRALNPDAALPDEPITVVHRSDGSGTTAIFTDYLAAVSPDWASKVGHGKSLSWPVGLGAKGNEGVSGQVKTTPYAVGYTELAYAVQSGLPMVAIQNRAGAFVTATEAGITAAAAGFENAMPEDFRISIVNAPGEKAYPIAAFTYLLVYADMPDAPKAQALVQFLDWALEAGQQDAAALHYAPLPDAVAKRVEQVLADITSGGKALAAN